MAVIFPGTISSRDTVWVTPVSAGPLPANPAGLDDLELLRMVGSGPRSGAGREAAFEELVSRYRGLVRHCVQRYWSGPEPAEDLMQVGYVGLVKAINNFDPVFGRSLAAYAQPCITGEIKRYFRDQRWQVHVKRSAKELAMEVRRATGQLTQELGRSPTESDLVLHLDVSSDELRDARLAERAFQPSSLDAPLSGQLGADCLADLLGEEDPRMEHMLSMQAVATHWGELPPREQKILFMRFYSNMTQVQVGEQLGISQMHVSRLIAHALGYLRPRLLGPDERASAKPGPSAQRSPERTASLRH